MEASGESSAIEPLLAIEREDLTGVLELTAQGITTNIYARAGEIAFADAGTVGETLGRMLIRAGRLSEEQVAAVIRRMTDALVDNEHVRGSPKRIATASSRSRSSDTARCTNAKTGILKTPKGYGRRVFVDGHIVGEGGRDHTIACGAHRIRVGSAGVERTVTVPCGGTIELD